ncbi:MAG: hypothetical protein JW788_04920 [Candidatus Omnitrophica bacterium]|nr:hypothetical protein [Candidatus Omnitrophota bacterium]
MPRSHTRLSACIFFACLAIVLATLVLNIFLALFKNNLSRKLNRLFFKPLSVKSIYYLPPNFIILKGFVIYKEMPAKNTEVLDITQGRIRFSILKLLFKRRFYISSLTCVKPKGDYDTFFAFVRDNYNQIYNFILGLPRHSIKLSIVRSELREQKKGMPRKNFTADLFLNIEEDSFYGQGRLASVTLEKIRTKAISLPVKFALRGKLSLAGLSLEEMDISSENLHSRLRGSLNPNAADCKGFILINTTGKKWNLRSTNKKNNKAVDFSAANLCILDIDCRASFNPDDIAIERLSFSINNNPVKLRGNILFNPLSLKFKISSVFRNLENSPEGFLKNINIESEAILRDEKLDFDGIMDINLSKDKKGGLPLEKIIVGLKGLTFYEGNGRSLNINTKGIDFFCKTKSNEYKINLEDLKTEVSTSEEDEKLIKFEASCYSGKLNGKAYLKMRHFTPEITADASLSGLNANELNGILIHFSKVYGKLNSQMRFLSYPELSLKGMMDITNGYLDDFEFFKWLAEFFDLPSLKKFPFNSIETDFFADEKGAGFSAMCLDSRDLRSSGYFKIGENSLVASKITLALSYPLMSSSSKLTRLLKILRKKTEFLNFDFQLSGNLNRMNFYWLSSDFKNEMRRVIPDFIERGIEKNIEGFIDSLSN